MTRLFVPWELGSLPWENTLKLCALEQHKLDELSTTVRSICRFYGLYFKLQLWAMFFRCRGRNGIVIRLCHLIVV